MERYGVPPGEQFFAQVCEWLTQHRDDRFFLWVDSFQPHEPWDAGEPYRSMYEPRFGYEGRYLPMPMAPDAEQWMRPGDIEHVRALYKAGVTETDAYVGRVLATLDELALTEDTLVLLLSDHGMPLGEHGLVRKFGYPLYEELSRIAWLMRKPGLLPAGREVDSLVSNVDFLPTLLELCKIPLDVALDGTSLLPLVGGTVDTVRDQLFLGAYNYRTGVRTAQHKFIDNRGEKPDELYDMQADPLERSNILADNLALGRELHRAIWDFHGPWKAKLSRHHLRATGVAP